MRRFSLLFLIYLAVGVVFAISKHQITIALLKDILQALLYVLLWPLNAFGLLNLKI